MRKTIDATEALAQVAHDYATAGAADYFRARGHTPTDFDAVTAALADHVRGSIDEAMADARDAFAVGMTDVGCQLFATTMRLAGIRAAKEVMGNPS